MTWTAEDILPLLDFPRENATEGLLRGQAVLDSLLQSIPAPVQMETFSVSTHRMTAVGICMLLAACGMLVAAVRPHLRWTILQLASLGMALVCATGGFDALLPHAEARNIFVTVPAGGTEHHSVLISAHLDSRTAPFDHVGRGVILLLVLLGAPLAVLVTVRQGGGARRWLCLPGCIAVLLLATESLGGRWVQPRSHGMRDNAAACALAVELCSRALHRPLEHTRLQFAWWSAEELAAQGSQAWVQRHPAHLPDFVLNFEALGSGGALAVGGLEWTGRSLRRADAELVQQVRALSATPVRTLRTPIVTDAGAFLGMGVPAVTLLNLPQGERWPRGLHRPGDDLASVDAAGLDQARQTLLALLHTLDAAAPEDSARKDSTGQISPPTGSDGTAP